jgi:hypothetical protein
MDGEPMMDWWILDMRNTTVFIMGQMSLPDELNTSME